LVENNKKKKIEKLGTDTGYMRKKKLFAVAFTTAK
jgi:hypothetical protein